MRIAVISDTHLGYAYTDDTEDDSFVQFGEALDRAIAGGADLILLPGDIFDSRTPKQETWAKALKLFQKPLLAKKNGTRVERYVGKQKEISPMAFQGVPVVAIHGTHERRGEHLVNPVELLEEAGYLIHLDKSGVVLEKNGERVAIIGLSGVPERDVKNELALVPKPVEGAFNVFVFHQSTKEEIYDADEAFISFDDLPKGFDLYIDGHIHWRKWLPEKRFLIAGSTVITQQKEKEAQQGKGFFIVETSPLNASFVRLESQRPFYFKKISFDSANQDKVSAEIASFLDTVPRTAKKPLVKIKLVGKMEVGRRSNQIDLSAFRETKDAIVSIDNELESDEFKKLVAELRSLHQSKKSVDEMGLDLIRRLLEQTNYDGIRVDDIIDALADGDTDFVMKKVLEKAQQ
ncbi:MAG: metallophosphoesterase [archaeon]